MSGALRGLAACAFVVAAGAAACTLANPLGAYGSGGEAPDASEGGGARARDGGFPDAGSRACPAGVRGGPMASAGTFCIDAHEVTQREYKAFVDAKGSDVSGQPPTCAGNTSYLPGTPAANGCTAAFYNPIGKPDQPIVCVDWCDAFAYCAWAGKRLCGAIGGGSLTSRDYLDPARSQWLFACSVHGIQAYPYGDAYDGKACNGRDYGLAGIVDSGAIASCVGGYAGIFDMSGNVWEWEDACATDAGTTQCRHRGGSFAESSPEKLRCDSGGQVNSALNTFTAGNVGFRCCER